MKKAVVILAAAVALGTGAPARTVTAAPVVDKGIVGTDYVVVAATVEAVDYERRTITIKGPDNKVVTLRASKKIKKLGEIRKNDLVTAEYLDAAAVVVRKPDGHSPPGFLRDVAVAPRGKEAEGWPVDTVQTVGTVEAIDYDQRSVTIKSSDGTVHTWRVDSRVKKLRDIFKGDKVIVRATEPLALRLRPVEK